MLPAVPAAAMASASRARGGGSSPRESSWRAEISSSDTRRLITEGIYGRVRNPRYLEFVLLSFVYAAFANYGGVWLMYALMFPAIHLVVLLEERNCASVSERSTRTTAARTSLHPQRRSPAG